MTAAKGMKPLRVGLLVDDATRDRLIDEHLTEEYRRMCALADRLDVEESPLRWYIVALALARKHVPELKEAVPRGRRQKWGDYERGVLAVEVKRLKEEERLSSDLQACRRLAR